MNYKMIRFVISWVLKVEGMLMLFPATWAMTASTTFPKSEAKRS